MTKIIGLTGGIGTGKTTVSRIFSELGVPVYIADDEARRITALPETQSRIIAAFGTSIVNATGSIDRKKLADIVFSDKSQLQRLNSILHPLVASDFREWLLKQKAPFVIRESAILFESATNGDCAKIIVVTAPLDLRVSRIISRDGISRDAVIARMDNQWPEHQKIALADYVIVNTDLQDTTRQIRKIFTELQHI